jgi:hypothetical protein
VPGKGSLNTQKKIAGNRNRLEKITRRLTISRAKRLGYSVRVHENLLIFRKPI